MRTLSTLVLAALVLAALSGTALASYRPLHITRTFVFPERETMTIDDVFEAKELHYGEFGELEHCNVFHSDGSCSYVTVLVTGNNADVHDQIATR